MAHLEPPAAIPPVAAPALVGTAAPITYRQLFADATRDAVYDRPGEYLAGYRFTDAAGAVPVPATLRDQTSLMCDRQPMAFLCLTAHHDGISSEVRILHRFMRYLELPGEPATGFHDHVLGLVGDIRPNQYPVVEVPGSSLHLASTQVRVPTAAAMDGLLAAWPRELPALGPYLEDGEVATELVRPRNIQLLPSRYAALLVHRENVTPRQAYMEIAGAIRSDGNDEACADVLTWLRAACTCRGGAGPLAQVPVVLQVLPPVHLPEAVYNFVCLKVASDFPASRGGTEARGDPNLAEVVRALSARGMTGSEGVREAKTVKDTYRETYTVLLRYSRVEHAEDVAPLWDRLANAHKSEHQQTILQQEFAKVCQLKGLAPELYCPVVTSGLKQMVVSFGFAGVGPDDLASGCNPFQVTYAGARDYYAAQAAAGVTQQLDQGLHNANLADIQAIKEKEKVRFPSDLHQVAITLQRYAVLVQTLFQGKPAAVHPFVQALWNLAVGFQNRLPFIIDRHQGLGASGNAYQSYPARILRTVQIQGYEYLQGVGASMGGFGAVDNAPDFAPLLQDLQRGTYHTSNGWVPLPAEYMVAMVPLSMAAPAMGSVTVSTTAGSSAASAVSALTTPTTAPGTRSAAPTQTRHVNTAIDTDFSGAILRGGLGPLLRAHRPPRNDAGHEFCVAWWCKGGCYTACGRRAAHVPFANATERARLWDFVREHLVQPAE